MIKSFIKRNKFAIIGIPLGAIAGFVYYQQVGCLNGCTITGKPINSSLYGALMAAVAFSMFDARDKENKSSRVD